MELYNILRNLAIKTIVTLPENENLFDHFQNQLDTYDTPGIKQMSDIKKAEKKFKGDMFELFCLLYLYHINEFQWVSLFKDVPRELLQQMNFIHKGDFGIDIIAFKNNEWYAIQCKYRKREVTTYKGWSSDVIPWSDIATFYALVAKTGPWNKNIIMTSAKQIRRITGKSPNDISLCKGTFQKLNTAEWYKMFNITGLCVNSECQQTIKPNITELRLLREKHFQPSN